MMTKYHNPLAALVVEFTYHNSKFTKNNREWWGRTRELAEQLSIRYMDKVAFVESRRIKELEEVLNIERSSDLRRFARQMRTCAYILRDVGVKVKWQRLTDRKANTDEKYTYTRWMIEAPRWRRSEP